MPTRTTAHARATAPDLSHAGAGSALVITYFALIPGVLPTLALAGVAIAFVLLPALVFGLAVAILAGPPYALWRLATRSRRRSNAGPPGSA